MHMGLCERDVLDLYAERFYSGAATWPAKINEDVFDINIDGNYRCDEVPGLAVDVDRNGTADIFLYDPETAGLASITSKKLDSYLSPLICEVRETRKGANCNREPEMTHPDVAFDIPGRRISGRLYPDSYGKIESIVVFNRPEAVSVIERLMELRSDISFQILYGSGLSWNGLLFEGQSKVSKIFYYDTDDNRMMWPRDIIRFGYNELGMRFILEVDHRVDPTIADILGQIGGMKYLTGSTIDGGDMLTTSSHTFMHQTEPQPYVQISVFEKTMAYGNKIVEIEEIPSSAAHLDMVLTPLEDKINGRPVVLLACPKLPPEAPPEFSIPFYRKYFDKAFEKDRDIIHQIFEILEGDFYVVPIPYVYSGQFVDSNNFSVGPPIARPIVYSYNNVLIERYREGDRLIKRVYLPVYDEMEDANNEAARIYGEILGYEVKSIEMPDYFVAAGGSIRCLTAVAGRSGI